MDSLLAEPRDRRRRRTRSAVLDAARVLFARPQGYRFTAVEELAQTADVALTTIYSNFPGGKSDVYAVLACQIAREHCEAMSAALAGIEPGAPAAAAAFDEYLDFHQREPLAFRILGLTDVSGDDSETVRAAMSQVRIYLADTVQAVIDSIGAPTGIARARTIEFWAAINGLMALRARGLIDDGEALALQGDVRTNLLTRLAEGGAHGADPR